MITQKLKNYNAKIDYDIPFVDDLTGTLSIGVDESEGIGVTDPLIPADEDADLMEVVAIIQIQLKAKYWKHILIAS